MTPPPPHPPFTLVPLDHAAARVVKKIKYIQSDQYVFNSKQSAPTPKRTRLSYKDITAIIETAKEGEGKKAVRDKMMSDYQIGRTAHYAIFRNSK